MTTNEKISAAILTRVAAGMPVREAIDAVLGAGVSAKLVSDLWASLQVAK